VFPSAHQSTVEPAITAPDDTVDDLIAVQGFAQQVSPGDTTAVAACASIEHPLTTSEPTLNATVDENLVDRFIVFQGDPPVQNINPRLQHDLDLWQRIKDYD